MACPCSDCNAGWLVVLACVLSGVLLAKCPGAIPEGWLRRSEEGRAREVLLK